MEPSAPPMQYEPLPGHGAQVSAAPEKAPVAPSHTRSVEGPKKPARHW